MIGNARRNDLISHDVEVALAYNDMLGLDEANDYLEHERVPCDVAGRFLLTGQERQLRQRQRPRRCQTRLHG